jgi:hypothetical protein
MAIKISRAEKPLANFYVDKQEWAEQAACKGKPVAMFFEDLEVKDETKKLHNMQAVRKLCGDCPVRKECAEQTMKEEGSAQGGRYGFRGCLTPKQRRMLHKQGGLKGKDPKRVPQSR